MTTFEYCLNNVDAGTRERLSDLDCSVERRCLQRCGDCYRSDFLVVDGELETGESHEALLAATEVEES
jgi:uncharacterized protein YuzB (UPF0349 family)